jgi:hypothetical protein
MSEERETRLCRFCCEDIDRRAKRCPHCRSPQAKWALSLPPGFVALGLALASSAPP